MDVPDDPRLGLVGDVAPRDSLSFGVVFVFSAPSIWDAAVWYPLLGVAFYQVDKPLGLDLGLRGVGFAEDAGQVSALRCPEIDGWSPGGIDFDAEFPPVRDVGGALNSVSPETGLVADDDATNFSGLDVGS